MREDRKKLELQTSAYIETLKRDILRYISASGHVTAKSHPVMQQRMSSLDRPAGASSGVPDGPAPAYPGSGGGGGSGGGAGGGGAIASQPLRDQVDYLRREIVGSVRDEMFELVRQMTLQAPDGAGRSLALKTSPASMSLAPPVGDTDLYQTHLYTQL